MACAKAALWLSSASEKSPHHHRIVAEGDDNNIEGERYHHFNGQQKSLFLKWVHRQASRRLRLK
jgi:hypothetical protein